MRKKTAVQRFEARLVNNDQGLGWVVVEVPFLPAEVWTEMIRLRVKGTVNGFAFRTSFFSRTGGGGFLLLVNGAMQKGAGVRLGDVAKFEVEPDLEERPAELPDELAVLLDEVEGLRRFYDELSEYARRELGKWINGVKSEASRMKRCEQAAERLLSTMEAEVELPPLMATAMRLRPKAKAGWAKMTAAQRRGELMAVFSYQSPEARERRLGKMLDVAEGRGE